MKAEFKKGQSVFVATRKGQIKGIISHINMNICTWETEYSIDYQKNGKTWTMIGVPAKAITINE